jgi:DNA-binding NtrC family response regulator
MTKKILIIDDDEDFLITIKKFLIEYNNEWEVDTACSALKGKELVELNDYDTILLDIKMEGENGVTLLENFKKTIATTPVIMVSGQSSIQLAIDCIHKGAMDYIEKPIDKNRLIISLTKALNFKQVLRGYNQYKDQSEKEWEIVGESEAIKSIKKMIAKIAPNDLPVLILGETGTGKELIARAIHRLSARASNEFVHINSNEFPRELINSELFGHKKGSFSGAIADKIGYFQKADRGTLFIDEIGDMPFEVQTKILRAIENKEFHRIGDPNLIKVDVRIITATNRDLPKLIEQGFFREDLYYRLKGFEIFIPPLRDRVEDIPLLAKHFAELYAKSNKLNDIVLTEPVYKYLQILEYKGNVRQLKQLVEKLIATANSKVIDLPDLFSTIEGNNKQKIYPSRLTLDHIKSIYLDLEKRYYKDLLFKNDMNIKKTAEELGMDRSNLYKKLKELNVI